MPLAASLNSPKVDIPTIDSKLLYEVLKKKGIKCFHHANTVKTSLTFIKEEALLSRSYIESHGLTQTKQYTDDKDKELNIWDSVFLDGTDLHKKFVTRNKYGPILFLINLEILLSREFPNIRVTKSNPDEWNSTENMFYGSIEDVDRDYLTSDKLRDGKIMFLLDEPEKKVSLRMYCKKIVVDDPRLTIGYSDNTRKEISEMIKTTFEDALKRVNLKEVEVEIRHANLDGCNCYHQYKMMYYGNKGLFDKLFKK